MRADARACLVGLVLAWAAPAGATPSRWALAREPGAYADEQTRAAAEVEILLDRQASSFDVAFSPKAHTSRARRLLEEGGAARSRDPYLRLVYGRVLHDLGQWQEAGAALASVLADPRTPIGLRDDALSTQALNYARLDRQDLEIETYEDAIAFAPAPHHRTTMLANQAEAFMVRGDISRAIAGYQAALETLTWLESRVVPGFAPTTYWSLGVALDRSGDLNGGLAAIAKARAYDPLDRSIGSDSWFFVPAWEEDYYAALGHWLNARSPGDVEERLGEYERTILAWKQYLARAPEDGVYVPIARARLRAAEAEALAFGKRARTPTPIDPAPARR